MEILASFPTISLPKLKVLETLQGNIQTLDNLGSDFCSMIQCPMTADLYIDVLLDDLQILAAEAYEDTDRKQFEFEIRQMLHDIQHRFRSLMLQPNNLVAIRFELPDTMIFSMMSRRSNTRFGRVLVVENLAKRLHENRVLEQKFDVHRKRRKV